MGLTVNDGFDLKSGIRSIMIDRGSRTVSRTSANVRIRRLNCRATILTVPDPHLHIST